MTHVIAAFFVLHIEEALVARPLIMQIPKCVEHIVYKPYITIFPFDVSVYFIFHYWFLAYECDTLSLQKI